jgi:hypothetical protein
VRPRLLAHAPAIDQGQSPEDKAQRRIAQRKIFGDRERRHEVQFLRDGGDAVDDRVVRARQAPLASTDGHASLIRPQDAAEDAHQGRFAGAVLADKSMDFAGAHFEIDAIEGRGCPETLADSMGAGRHVVHGPLASLRNRITG